MTIPKSSTINPELHTETPPESVKTKTGEDISVSIQDIVQPHFKTFWTTNKPYVILKGGRGSFKSATVSIKLVSMLLEYANAGHDVTVECFAKTQDSLKSSIYGQIVRALTWLHVTDMFTYGKSPLVINYKYGDSHFYFHNIETPEKLKSNTDNNVIALWYEELTTFRSADDIENNNPTFIRNKADCVPFVRVYYSYNPPRNPYDWVNEWTDAKRNDPEYLIDHSTYKDDKLGFTTDQQLKLIKTKEKLDPDYYRWQYLGEVVGLGNTIYHIQSFTLIDHVPDDENIVALYTGLDSGQEVSATTEVAVCLTNKGNVIVWDTYYYSPVGKANKKAPSQLVDDLHTFEERVQKELGMTAYRKTSDSATTDFALEHQMNLQYNEGWHHLAKKRKRVMISYVQELSAEGRIYVRKTPRNMDAFIDEHKRYEWDEKTVNSDDPKPVKVHDHTCDAFQYVITDNLRDFGLKF